MNLILLCGNDMKGKHLVRDMATKDWFFRNAFVQASNKVTPPLDVYSAVASTAIVALSEVSIAKGGEPVDFPLVNGKTNKPIFLPEELGC